MEKNDLKRFGDLFRTSDWPAFLSASLLAFSIPIYKPIAPYLILLLLLCCIPFRHARLGRSWWPLFFSALLYGWHFLGLNWSEDLVHGHQELEYKASLLVFPVIALVLPQVTRAWRQIVLWSFTAAGFFFMLFSVVRALVRYAESGNTEALGYGELAIWFHPTYISVYICFSLGWVLYSSSKGNNVLKSRVVSWLLAGFFSIYVSMLASKAGILTALMIIVWSTWIGWKNKQSMLKWIPVHVLLAFLIVGSALSLPKTAGRIGQAVDAVENLETPRTTVAYASSDLREVVWNAALTYIRTHPWGAGTGDTTNELVKIYAAEGEDYAAEKNLNAHNQFLQVACEHGWPGLILLVFFLGGMILQSIRRKDAIYQLFLAITIFNFLFESFLEVQAGVVFFSFWAMMFCRSDDPGF